MAKKQFKAESKRLLDLMINSIYTHKEIFLREIISNASDAIDKLCYASLSDENVPYTKDDYKIKIFVDQEARTITVSDNGIGMNQEDMEKNLGVIAQSGSLKFKSENGDLTEDTSIIGQFGVGFYSAFMVSDYVTVKSLKYGETVGAKWESTGTTGYTVTECPEKTTVGTDVIMHIKPDSDAEKFTDYMNKFVIRDLVRKYSDYIRWPIAMDIEDQHFVESKELDDQGRPKYEYVTDMVEVIMNTQVPIWQRSKSEVSDEECKEYYQKMFYDTNEPISVIRVNAEGSISYKAMLFVPAMPSQDFYSRDYKPGLRLYSNGVMIMEYCADILPDCFRFVRGVVDSPDLSLNISREILQHDRQLRVISNNLTKKVKSELIKLRNSDRKKYEEFYKAFGHQLKFSTVSAASDMREMVRDLLLFHVDPDRQCTLQEYVDNMPPSQDRIYYVCADNLRTAMRMPQTEAVKRKGYEVLYLTDPVDEFVIRALEHQGDKFFQNVSKGDLGLFTEEEILETVKAAEEEKELLDFMRETLAGQVVDVRFSTSLVSYPVCLSSEGQITLEMERYFRSVPGDDGSIRAARVLEINAKHPSIVKVREAYASDKARCADMTKVLFGQASLIAGMPIDDPAEYTELVCSLF